MTRTLRSFAFFFLLSISLSAQTSLMGKVTDTDSNEPLISASILVTKNGVYTAGTTTDFDGNYNISPIDPGTYEITFSYTGYQSQQQEGVIVFAGRSNKLDVKLASGVLLGGDVEIIGYRIPLVEQDNTTQGQTITSEQIRNLPLRNINAIAATTAGLSSADEGRAISVRGSRTDATDYYIDGIRVSGSSALIPESEIDQLQVITGGVEARYGDVTGGVISITTKGFDKKWSGGFEAETSEIFDPYNNRLVGFNVSGPLAKKSSGEPILGIRLSGRYTYQLDDNPSAGDLFRVTDDALARLEANPVITRTSSNGVRSAFVAADFATLEDVNAQRIRPFEDFTRYDLNAKIDARITNSIDLSFTGAYSSTENLFTPEGNINSRGSTSGNHVWRTFNSHNNPFDNNDVLRGNVRLRHRLSSNVAEENNKGTIRNAFYTLQFGYENSKNNRGDIRHGNNYFDYGYVGNFDFEWIPTFNFDPITGTLIHTDYRQILRGYTPGSVNPVLANYNNALDINSTGEGLNSQVPNSIVFFFGQPNASANIGRDDFYAVNGRISDQFENAWGFHTNVGWVYNLARRNSNDLYNFTASSSFDFVPKGSSDKGRHSIEFGVWYEQRINRRYDVFPRNLWDVARQQANNHIQGIAENADSIAPFQIPGFPSTTALLELSIVENPDNKFYRSIRSVTGQPLTSFVNVDGLRPDQFDLSMFSAKELNDQGILNYYGYDYLGNEFNGTFDEFFTATDANGVRTFPVAPNRPILAAAYLQDKFTFRDIIFRVGLRVERYDANTKVLKDPYSLYEIQGAADFHAINTDFERPGNIGDNFKVYVNDGNSAVQAYRDGDQWYFANGTPANSPIEIFPGGLVFPAYADERVNSVANFIKSRDFDPSVSFQDYEPTLNWMPRLAFSFPISEEANFFAHYDILTSRPPSNTIATAYDYFYFTDLTGIRNNPNLQPQRTISYEVGFQQQLSASSALKLSAYYKEQRDMIQRRTFFPVPIVNQYATYDNIDFGTVKGFSLAYDLRRTSNVSLQANYTLQFADGTGSDSDSQRGLTSRGNIRNLIPLDFDERHRFVAVLDYRYGSDKRYNGPKIGNKDILSNFGINLNATAVSGRPYTATIQPLQLDGTGFTGALNGTRKPWAFTLNLRVDKDFKMPKGGRLNAYVRVSNLLDRENVLNVYSATGSPYDDGYLASARGLNQIATIQNSTREVESFLAAYQWAILNPGFFSLPRRMFGGVIYNF